MSLLRGWTCTGLDLPRQYCTPDTSSCNPLLAQQFHAVHGFHAALLVEEYERAVSTNKVLACICQALGPRSNVVETEPDSSMCVVIAKAFSPSEVFGEVG
jgi:hypothetical protein